MATGAAPSILSNAPTGHCFEARRYLKKVSEKVDGEMERVDRGGRDAPDPNWLQIGH